MLENFQMRSIRPTQRQDGQSQDLKPHPTPYAQLREDALLMNIRAQYNHTKGPDHSSRNTTWGISIDRLGGCRWGPRPAWPPFGLLARTLGARGTYPSTDRGLAGHIHEPGGDRWGISIDRLGHSPIAIGRGGCAVNGHRPVGFAVNCHRPVGDLATMVHPE